MPHTSKTNLKEIHIQGETETEGETWLAWGDTQTHFEKVEGNVTKESSRISIIIACLLQTLRRSNANILAHSGIVHPSLKKQMLTRDLCVAQVRARKQETSIHMCVQIDRKLALK